MENALRLTVIIVIAILGGIGIIGALTKMKGSPNSYTLKTLGLILITTFVALLAALNPDSLEIVTGILGAIAGYLFGIQNRRRPEDDT